MGYNVGRCGTDAFSMEGDEAISKDQSFSRHVLNSKKKLFGSKLE